MQDRRLPDMTKEQVAAIHRKAAQSGENANELVNKAQGLLACDGAVTVPWCGMWLCIERDGYTHS